MQTAIIPQTYDQWRHCIIVECGLELSPSFIENRLAALNNEGEHYTQQFIHLYGREYLDTVIAWFLQAQKSV